MEGKQDGILQKVQGLEASMNLEINLYFNGIENLPHIFENLMLAF